MKTERVYNVVLHLVLLILLREEYWAVFAALLAANVLSNIREVSEHGDFGKAAYVNLKFNIFSLLFLATPGFWNHGVHHMHPEVHYLSSPLWASSLEEKEDLRVIQSRSIWRYFLAPERQG